MRLWSIHPKYLDTKGLVALWRESLLARNVLEDKTRSYKYHPQLQRFKSSVDPINAINFYLKYIWIEAEYMNFHFNQRKLGKIDKKIQINVTDGQINFEKIHLLKKLRLRDKKRYNDYKSLIHLEVHPLFKIVEGNIESWEKL
ncbi:MAG: pyrimidine dimer DNA glycosylase/endonuclease V [Candidatus Cloacimonetes bacterium]|nr:pyrimidine dimer DNA glycosylase/endonuclease V [Candidatus Cloacimonadota bacterium]